MPPITAGCEYLPCKMLEHSEIHSQLHGLTGFSLCWDKTPAGHREGPGCAVLVPEKLFFRKERPVKINGRTFISCHHACLLSLSFSLSFSLGKYLPGHVTAPKAPKRPAILSTSLPRASVPLEALDISMKTWVVVPHPKQELCVTGSSPPFKYNLQLPRSEKHQI